MAQSTRRARGARADVMEMWKTPKQSWPIQILGALIRWRAELIVLTVTVVTVLWLTDLVGTVWTWILIGAAFLVTALWYRPRRFVLGRVWCVLDRHRLRTCLRNAKVRTMNLDGALPFLVWARPTKTGERVWCWTRAGSSPDDLENVLGYVASACYARDARLHRVRSFTTLVAIEIIRRDPLGKPDPIDSPLAKLSNLAHGRPTVPEGSAPMTAVTVTDLPATPDGDARVNTTDTATVATPLEKKPRTAKKADAPTSGAPSVMAGGDELSDYI